MLRSCVPRYRTAALLTGFLAVTVVLGRPEASPGQFDPFAPGVPSTRPGHPPAQGPVDVGPVNEAVRRALAKRITVEFKDTPLVDVVRFLEKTCEVPVFLDRGALQDIGIPPDAPVSLAVSDMSVACVLAHALRPLDLTYVPRGEVLEITTPEEAEQVEVTQFHPVGDLVGYEMEEGEFAYDFDSVADLITIIVQPTSWDCCGPSRIWPLRCGNVQALAFPQTPEVHAETAKLLDGIRTVLRRKAGGESAASVVLDLKLPDPAAYGSMRKALDRKISLAHHEMPLAEAIDRLRKVSGINVLLDEKSLADVGIPTDIPISIDVNDLSLASALSQIVDKVGLTYDIWNEAVVVTTPEEAETRFVVGIYDVTDVVRSDDSARWPWLSDSHDLLERLIRRSVRPDSWDSNGGPGTVAPFVRPEACFLIVSQSGIVHEETGQLLGRLRDVVKQAKGSQEADVLSLLRGLFNEPRLASFSLPALSQRVTLDFQEATLTEIAGFIEKTCKVACHVSGSVLQRGDAASERITFRLHNATLETALTLLVEQLGLTWNVRDGGIWIGERQYEEPPIHLEIYRVADLVACRDEEDKIWYDFGSLESAIAQNVGPADWGTFDGPCAIASGTLLGVPVLLVWQTDRGHEEVAEFLEECRKLASQASGDGRPPLRRRYGSPSYFRGGFGGGLGMF